MNSKEQRELFNHLGNSLLSSLLYTIMDWQYFILLWIITSSGVENIATSIAVVQMFNWVVSLSYYYIKYKVINKQNYFYKLISSRHYKYVLTRIANNAPYQWISEKSPSELTSQLNTTDKGLHYMINFITTSTRLVSSMLFSISIISWNYPSCFLIFLGIFTVLYGIISKNDIFKEHNRARNKFQKINNNNNQVISNNISVLLDSILHNTQKKVIKNITIFNNITKSEQVELFNSEDKTYTKIGISIVSGYSFILLISSSFVTLNLNNFITFFISTLLTYKCINNNVNEMCDMFINIRQSQVDFESLQDIWDQTSTRRRSYVSYNLPTQIVSFKELENYHIYHFSKKEKVIMSQYEDFIRKNNLIDIFYEHSSRNYKKLLKSFYMTNKNEMIKLENYKDFIQLDFDKMEQFYKFNNDNDKITEKSIYSSYLKMTNLKKDKPKFKLYINYLNFCFPYLKNKNRYQIKYVNDRPLVFDSNNHVLIDGTTGSGKTTLMKIIRGIIPLKNYDETDDINENVINMNIKTDIEKTSINWTNLSNSVCYCQQNSISFIEGMIFQILTDDYTVSYEELDQDNIHIMNQALTISCVDSKFRNLKFKCSISNISGGQIQRVDLAKNLYRILKDDKQIIILDEVDAGLDIETAIKVIINILIVFKEKLLFIALHTEELKKMFKYKIKLIDGLITYEK